MGETIVVRGPTVEDAERRAKREAAIQLLRSWCEVDEAEADRQRQTLEYLMRVLDEDRFSDRKLFPERSA